MSESSNVRLCPAQQRAFDALCAGLQAGSVFRLWGGIGRGKTTVLHEVHKKTGGVFLNLRDFVEASAGNHPLALEETLYRLLLDASRAHPVVILDDVHLLDLYSSGCHFYPRSGYFNAINSIMKLPRPSFSLPGLLCLALPVSCGLGRSNPIATPIN